MRRNRRGCSACGSTRCRSKRPVAATESVLAPLFAGRPRDVTEENLQARIRGVLLMALLEQVRRAAGDDRQQVGDVGRLRHAVRRHVRRLLGAEGHLQDRGVRAGALAQRARRRTARCGPRGRVIPESSITKAPTAELRPNQTDQDSLPPYDELDAILHGPGRRRAERRPRSSRAASRARRSRACSGCSTPPNTSGGRRRRASRSRARASAAIGAIR